MKKIAGTNFYWNESTLKIEGVLFLFIAKITKKENTFYNVVCYGQTFENIFLDEYNRTIPHLFLDEAKAFAEQKIKEIFYS
jgi:hypothetical protein